MNWARRSEQVREKFLGGGGDLHGEALLFDDSAIERLLKLIELFDTMSILDLTQTPPSGSCGSAGKGVML